MIRKDQNQNDAITERFRDIAKLEAVLIEAGRRAIQEHAQAGRKVPFWKDGRVVWKKPEIDPVEPE